MTSLTVRYKHRLILGVPTTSLNYMSRFGTVNQLSHQQVRYFSQFLNQCLCQVLLHLWLHRSCTNPSLENVPYMFYRSEVRPTGTSVHSLYAVTLQAFSDHTPSLTNNMSLRKMSDPTAPAQGHTNPSNNYLVTVTNIHQQTITDDVRVCRVIIKHPTLDKH